MKERPPYTISGLDVPLATWAAGGLGTPVERFRDFRSVGVIVDGKIACAVVLHNYVGHQCDLAIYSKNAKWATRRIGREILSWPFEQLGCVRIQGIVRRQNKSVRSFLERMGWKYEGKLRRGWSESEDAIIYSLLKDEFYTNRYYFSKKDTEKYKEGLAG